MQTLELVPGQVFADDYVVVERLAQGGMGAIYVVHQRSTSERRALKLMHPGLVSSERSRLRFDQEARIASQISSAHVVRVIQAGVDPASGTPWICMEMLEGEDLFAHVTRRGPLSASSVAVLFDQLGHALAQAHAAGIVHRDLKPENVFVCPPQSPGVPFTIKVLDFGIAKLAMGTPGNTQAIGTPFWMAPEQTGAGLAITPATDVWALGLIAFFTLTGRIFWRSSEVEDANVMMILSEIVLPQHPTPSHRAYALGAADRVPHGFDTWFARCVSHDPAYRYPEAGAACRDLRALLEQPGLTAPIAARYATAPTMAAPFTPAPFTPAPFTPAPFTPAPITRPPVATTAVITQRGYGDHAPMSGGPAPKSSPARWLWLAGAGGLALACCLGTGVVGAGAMGSGSLPLVGSSGPLPLVGGDCAETFTCESPDRQVCTDHECTSSDAVANARFELPDGTTREYGVASMARLEFSEVNMSFFIMYFDNGVMLVLYPPRAPQRGAHALVSVGSEQYEQPDASALMVQISSPARWPGRYLGRYGIGQGTVDYERADWRFGGELAGTIDTTLVGGGGRIPATVHAHVEFRVAIPE